MEQETEQKENTFKQRLAAYLLHPLAPTSKRMVLLRTNSSVSAFAFVIPIGLMTSAGLLFLSGVLGLISEALSIFLYWSDFNTWNAWQQGFAQTFGQIFLLHPILPTSRAAWWIDGLLLNLLLIAFARMVMRFFWHRLRRLWAYTRAKDPKAFEPQPEITFFPSLWFSTEVVDQIQPADASILIEENPEFWETSIADWRQKHPPEPIPLARIQIRLTQRCEIILTGQNGQTAAFFLTGAKHTEILAFFALHQPLYEWIAKEDFAPLLYHASKIDNFNSDVHRLHEEINKQAQEHNLILLEELSLGQTEAAPIPIRLLEEPRMIEGRSHWRLKPGCVVEVLPSLQTLYEHAKAEQDPQKPLDLAAREQALMNLAVDYGVQAGFLGIYQTKRSWEWLKDTYHSYRSMWLFLLIDTAERELRRAEEASNNAQAAQAIRDAARLYEWAVSAADNGLFPKLALPTRSLEAEGRICLIHALVCYRRLKDRRSARTLAHRYRDKRGQDWKPTRAMEEAWPGIFDEKPEGKKVR